MRLPCLLAAAAVTAAGCADVVSDKLLEWRRGTGCVSGRLVAYAAFPRDTGVGTGCGYSVTMPPLLPLAAAAICGFVHGGGTPPEAIFEAGIASGVRYQDRRVVSEVAFDLTFAETFHDDLDFGGRLDYESWLLGVRLGGPARYVPSYTLSAGWGWHRFEFENRPKASVEGPYVGAGLAFHLNENVRLGLECERQFYTHYVRPWTPSDGAAQVRLKVTGAWYW